MANLFTMWFDHKDYERRFNLKCLHGYAPALRKDYKAKYIQSDGPFLPNVSEQLRNVSEEVRN